MDDAVGLRIHIRRGAKLPTPFLWEIYLGNEERCISRSNVGYPTRGSARKAAKAALQRLAQQNESDGRKISQTR